MPSYENHRVSTRTKLLLVGDSGIGKSGHLASLANAGYNLRILDFDDGLDILSNYLTPDGRKHVNYVTLKDTPTEATAWKTARSIIYNKWKVGDEDLGPITSWGESEVLVLDSLTFAGDAAKRASLALSGKKLDAQLSQADWGEALRSIELMLDYVMSDHIKCNVIMTTLPMPVEDESGVSKLYPQVVTAKFSTKVARYFNNMFRLDRKRDGKYVFQTSSTPRMTLKSSAPNALVNEVPADLRAVFEILQNNTAKAAA